MRRLKIGRTATNCPQPASSPCVQHRSILYTIVVSESAHPWPRRLADRLDRALDYWLGYDAPPADRAVERSAFVPDARDQYCQRCGDTVGPGEYTDKGCASCRDQPALADAVVRLGPYVDVLREWVLALKYERWSPIGHELGRLLAQSIMTAGVIDRDHAVIVPMAMPWQRRMYRGIDHAQVIASAVAQHLDAPVARVLSKKHGPPQVALSASQRQRHGGRNLRLRKRPGAGELDGPPIALVGDLRTPRAKDGRAACRGREEISGVGA